MAEGAQEKTEQPTPRRLNKARQGGQVPQSQEMISALSLIALTATVALYGPRVTRWAMQEIREGFSCRVDQVADPTTFAAFVADKLGSVLSILAPFFIVLMVTGIVVNLAISGRTFNVASIFKVQFSKINPVKGFSRLFSVQSLVTLGLSVLKLTFTAIIAVSYVRKKISELATFQWTWDWEILTVIAQLILGVAIRLCAAVLIIGIIDLIYQKWKYIKDLKMTKQEVKDERRSAEGSPEVKRKIRQKQAEASMRRMMQDVPKSDVVLVNPTHVAVALKYESGDMAAPVVLAKGGDHVCEKIKEVARAYGVPIIRRPELARNIYSTVDIGKPIPEHLFMAVAEVLALIYRLRNRR